MTDSNQGKEIKLNRVKTIRDTLLRMLGSQTQRQVADAMNIEEPSLSEFMNKGPGVLVRFMDFCDATDSTEALDDMAREKLRDYGKIMAFREFLGTANEIFDQIDKLRLPKNK